MLTRLRRFRKRYRDTSSSRFCLTAACLVSESVQNASANGSLANRLDAGNDIIAVSTRGSGPGSETTVPRILAAERHIIEHLLRELR